MADAKPEVMISSACQSGFHGACTGAAEPSRPGLLGHLNLLPCECPMHDSPGALCWGDIGRIEVR